jgi:hypothetical protein
LLHGKRSGRLFRHVYGAPRNKFPS